MTTGIQPDYVSYVRKSKGRKAVKQQRTLTRLHVERNQGRLLREFRDDDQTAFQKVDGAHPKRDDFAAMLVMLAANPGLRVVAYHADRLTRNDEDTAALLRVCATSGNLVETTAGGAYDLSTANGRKRLRDDASAAIYEVDHMTERILEGRAVVAAEGRWLGGKRPFGWELDPAPVDDDGNPLTDEDGRPLRGILRLRPAEAEAIRIACDDLLKGVTTYRIARKWNAQGLRGTGKQAPLWKATEVRRVLLRPRNAGLMEYQGRITGPAAWSAIVDEPTWRKVAAKLRSPDRRTNPGNKRQHLLSGVALCGVCGLAVVCTSTNGRSVNAKGTRKVYVCRGVSGQHIGRDEAALDEFVIRVLLARFGRKDAKNLLQVREEGPDLGALEREAEAIRGEMRELFQQQLDRVITPAMLRQGMTQKQAELEQVTEQIRATEEASSLVPMLRNPTKVWEDLDIDQRSDLIRAVMTVTVLPGAKGRPAGWKSGQPYFDPERVRIDWKR